MSNYNGWKNYETWNVACLIQNDRGLYELAKTWGSYVRFVMEDISIQKSEEYSNLATTLQNLRDDNEI